VDLSCVWILAAAEGLFHSRAWPQCPVSFFPLAGSFSRPRFGVRAAGFLSVPAQALVFPLVVPGRFSCQVSAPEHPSLVSVFVHWFWPPVRFPPGARRRTDFAPRNRICSSFCSLGRFRFRGEVSIFASPVHAPRASITPPARLSLAFFVILVLPFEIPPPESRPGAVFCSSLPVSDFCLRAQSRMESIVDSFYTGRFLLPLSS
jgi:hypothetical protein